MAILNGLALEITKEVMGHADIKQTQHYRKGSSPEGEPGYETIEEQIKVKTRP